MDRTAALANFATVVRQASASGAVCSITVTGQAGARFALSGITLSGSSACSTAVQFTVSNGTGYLETFRIPAAAFAPIAINYGGHPPVADVSTNVVANVPSLGSGVLCDLIVKGFFVHE